MQILLEPALTWPYLSLLTALLFVVIFLRYLLASKAYHYVFFVALRKKWGGRIINPKAPQAAQARLEIRRSALTALIFAASGTGIMALWLSGNTQIYTEWAAWPWWYHFLSLPLALFLHETFYYWLHRWMHLPGVYRRVHRWHHDSIHTSSLTSFSFHPAEAALQALFLPALVVVMPLHVAVLLALLLVMTVSGIVNHAGIEVYPSSWARHRLARWVIGATHHDLHHKRFRFNFGLYFTFWDHWMKTESPDFERRFIAQTSDTKAMEK